MTRIDTKDMSIKIESSITWSSIQTQLDDAHDEVQDWYDDISHKAAMASHIKAGFEKELEAAKKFLEVGELNAEQQIRVLELIQDVIENDYNEDMDEYQWIRDGVYNWIEEEFDFPAHYLN